MGYRINRITSLTGHDLNDMDGRFTLDLAIRARRILQPAGGDQPADGSG